MLQDYETASLPKFLPGVLQGRSRNQGPFSREFTRKCMAPSNWVKMKYGRYNAVM